jgi:hypothetical protein
VRAKAVFTAYTNFKNDAARTITEAPARPLDGD